MLPPKKPEVTPAPLVVEEATYEDTNVVDVRARSFTAGSDFFNHGTQFGGEGAWTDEEEDESHEEPDCRHQ